jgi:hypothetical protein
MIGGRWTDWANTDGLAVFSFAWQDDHSAWRLADGEEGDAVREALTLLPGVSAPTHWTDTEALSRVLRSAAFADSERADTLRESVFHAATALEELALRRRVGDLLRLSRAVLISGDTAALDSEFAEDAELDCLAQCLELWDAEHRHAFAAWESDGSADRVSASEFLRHAVREFERGESWRATVSQGRVLFETWRGVEWEVRGVSLAAAETAAVLLADADCEEGGDAAEVFALLDTSELLSVADAVVVLS